ncbi:MAG: MFS transporter [Calditrichaeota bacterium]|nr:MFS transporter [Calditrichota bacterium]
MRHLNLNVWLLTIAQSLLMSVSSMIVLIGGLVGAKYAPVENLATLPVACVVIGTAIAVVPVTQLMKKLGRKRSFMLIISVSICNAIFATYTISIGHFYLFCLSTFLFGSTVACVMQFRFAAMESVANEFHAKAASTVLLGGIMAAFIGPEAAIRGKNLFTSEFTGSFILLAVLFLIALIVLIPFQNTKQIEQSADEKQRPLRLIMRQDLFWLAIISATIAYAVMSFIMTATPVSMHKMDGHSLETTKWVIQSHILAMFLPSLVAAWTIRKLGLQRMMIAGLLSLSLSVAIAFSGHAVFNYWLSLVLLGIGWNFLFIGGTTILPQTYHSSERFKVQAFNDFTIFSCQAIAALSAGWLVFSLGWELMLLITLPLLILQATLLFRFSYKKTSIA